MSRNRIMPLSDTLSCTAAIAFYGRYQERIADMETVAQRNNILSDMQQDFEREAGQHPQSRDKLSEIYQLLKMKCWEAG